ncbi:MAG: hypothetical protein QGF67_15865, partial [Lentisphaeria bacterium]|nr:hypothetical protein [Lentisphaeria bacterium]
MKPEVDPAIRRQGQVGRVQLPDAPGVGAGEEQGYAECHRHDNLADAGADLDILTDNGRTLLMIAASFGFRDISQLLLERCAAVHAQGSDG